MSETDKGEDTTQASPENGQKVGPGPGRRLWRVFRAIVVCSLLAILVVAVGLAYLRYRPNGAEIDPDLVFEDGVAVADGTHNSNTDLIFWRGNFYLIHASSPYHFGTERCKLVLWASPDCVAWSQQREIAVPGEGIRDPKFAAIGARLYIYVLNNTDFYAEPYTTAFMWTPDGIDWTALETVEQEGWLFWRPKTRDGKTWYMPAYWHAHGRSILLKSTDGEQWTKVSTIYTGDRNDETAIEFLPDGRMIATARLEVGDSLFGHPDGHTLVATAEPPYKTWSYVHSGITRLDGPALFSHEATVYAVGRREGQGSGFASYPGSVFGKKRTSLFVVEPEGLRFLSDLPSAGDTAYAGVVVRDDTAYISYYTSPIDTDVPWLMGMLLPSEIRVAKVDLASLKAIAAKKKKI